MAATEAPTPPERIRQARRQWLDQGTVSDGLITGPLQASWGRCRDFGLEPLGRPQGAPHASAAQLARALEHRHALVSHAKPVMAFINEQVRGSDNLVMLADAQGLLLHAQGDMHFADRAARVALRPGALWSEQWRGTNAIGTALAEGVPLVVHAGEHYLERNGFLTCAAAPIADPSGHLLGVLDISGDRRGYHRHTLALVRSGARMVEHQLFIARHGSGIVMRVHAQAEGLGTVTEGLLALSEDGWIVGATTAALELLGLERRDIGAATVERVLGCDLPRLLALGLSPRQLSQPLRGEGERPPVWVRLEPGQTLRRGIPPVSGGTGRQTTAAAHEASRQSPYQKAKHTDPTLLAASPSACDGVKAPPDALSTLADPAHGDSALQTAITRARKVMDKPAIALLLQGESGVGKEVFAQALHASSARRHQPFVAVNCAALPETLIEAELFGYRPGAFTGATRQGAPGRIREADGGTLFLDEIGDMPLVLQARLLRVLQQREVMPLGGGMPVSVDFRLICASHRKLKDEVAMGRFREDLYYRLNGLTLTLPPLRERQDLPSLVARLLAAEAPGRALALEPGLLPRLAAYHWPGNLRQLANALRTAVALLEDDEELITQAHLPEDLLDELRPGEPFRGLTQSQGLEPGHRPAKSSEPEPIPGVAQVHDLTLPADSEDLRQLTDARIRATLAAVNGNVSVAARRLGISRNTLYRRMRERSA